MPITDDLPDWIANHPDLVVGEKWLYAHYAAHADAEGNVTPNWDDLPVTKQQAITWSLSLIEAGALAFDGQRFTICAEPSR